MTVELSTLGSVIKTAYEGESDTNAFSDAYKALLDAYDVDLGTFSVPANTTISAFGATLVDDANAAAAIATLGLDADIATLSVPASTTISAFGATLVDDADAATARATLGVDAAGTDNSTDVTFAYATSPELNYLTLAGQQITLNPIDLAADVTGALPIANISATGTPDTTTFLRGDGSWSVPAGSVVEGTAILSTGEAGGTKFLREDGDGTCSWQEVAAAAVEGTSILSTGPVTDGWVLTADGAGGAAWEAAAGGGLTNWEESGTTLQPTTSGYDLGSSTNSVGDIFVGIGSTVGINAGSLIQFNASTAYFRVGGNYPAGYGANGVSLRSSGYFGWASSATDALSSVDTTLYRDAANTLALRNGTNAQTFNVYGTYTDSSNYERLAITGSAITVQTAGTGTDDIDLTLTPAGAGNVKFGTHSAIGAETVTGYITIKDSSGTTRKLAVVS